MELEDGYEALNRQHTALQVPLAFQYEAHSCTRTYVAEEEARGFNYL
jgi:hypothetical protein